MDYLEAGPHQITCLGIPASITMRKKMFGVYKLPTLWYFVIGAQLPKWLSSK